MGDQHHLYRSEKTISKVLVIARIQSIIFKNVQNSKTVLHSPALPKGASKKFYRPWVGPYKIESIISDGVYKISKEGRVQVVNFDRLKPYPGAQMLEPGSTFTKK